MNKFVNLISIINYFRLFFLGLIVLGNYSIGQQGNTPQGQIGIDEKLGNSIPMNLTFYNESGEEVELKNLITKPTVLALVYYHCPNVCSPLLLGVSEVVDRVELEPGKDFQVLTLSFDHNEKPRDAKRWKNEHLNSMRRELPENAWLFLTGDSLNIRRLTDEVGFYFRAEGNKDFAHMAALVILSPEGKITRYIFGTQFLPFDLKMAVIEAQKGQPRPTVNKILDFCYSYDRQGNKYVFNVTKVAGALILFTVVVLFAVLTIKSKVKNS